MNETTERRTRTVLWDEPKDNREIMAQMVWYMVNYPILKDRWNETQTRKQSIDELLRQSRMERFIRD